MRIDENGQKRADVCTPPEKVTFVRGSLPAGAAAAQGTVPSVPKLTARSLSGRNGSRGELNEDFYLLVELCRRRRVSVSFPSSFIMYITAWAAIPGGRSGMIFQGFVDIVKNADYGPGIVEENIRRCRRKRCASAFISSWIICCISRWDLWCGRIALYGGKNTAAGMPPIRWFPLSDGKAEGVSAAFVRSAQNGAAAPWPDKCGRGACRRGGL